MILIDANILIYSVNRDAAEHETAKRWLEEVLTGDETVAFSGNVLLAFLRVTTRPGLFRRPLPPKATLDLIASWLEQRTVTIVHPGARHFQILRDMLLKIGTAGNLTSDAFEAAIAMEHGAVLFSADQDFARFAGLKWKNPLA